MKRITAILIATVILLGLCLLAFPPMEVHAAEIIASGYCGNDRDYEKVTWTLDSEGTLTISGTGDMYSRSYYGYWYDIDCDDIKKVVVEEGVTAVGSYAFNYCQNLTSVTLASTVTKIGYNAFEDCPNLISVTMQEGLKEIDTYAFSNCSSLTSIDIPDSVVRIGRGAFYCCTGLQSVKLPNNRLVDYMDTFNDSIFYGCTSLRSVGPAGSGADVELPDGITAIGNGMFCGCRKLSSVVLPDTVTTIGGLAFYDCSSLVSITLPASITSIDSSAFGYEESYFSNGKPLWHILFKGTEAQWNAIEFGYDAVMEETVCHYGCTGDEVMHKYIIQPICNSGGTIFYECSICAESITFDVEPNGHRWKHATCTDPQTCTSCGKTIGEPLEGNGTHSWDAGRVTKEATCGEDGEMTFACDICHDTRTEVIGKTGEHLYDGSKDADCNICGQTREITTGKNNSGADGSGEDGGSTVIIIVAVVVVGGGLAVVVLKKRK